MVEYILEKLNAMDGIEAKKMFGGVGIFKDGTMFGMIAKNAFRLRVDETIMPDFEDKGMKPFHDEGKKKGMPYWEVPTEVLDDNDALLIWANKAYQVALSHKK